VGLATPIYLPSLGLSGPLSSFGGRLLRNTDAAILQSRPG
jgi:hypothetical protein